MQNALAEYLARWWPHAESAGAGRNGTDVLGTPGVVWECKTAVDFKRDFKPTQWVAQAAMHAPRRPVVLSGSDDIAWISDLPVTVYFPVGVGEKNTANTLAIVPLHVLMRVLAEAGYTPDEKIKERM